MLLSRRWYFNTIPFLIWECLSRWACTFERSDAWHWRADGWYFRSSAYMVRGSVHLRVAMNSWTILKHNNEVKKECLQRNYSNLTRSSWTSLKQRGTTFMVLRHGDWSLWRHGGCRHCTVQNAQHEEHQRSRQHHWKRCLHIEFLTANAKFTEKIYLYIVCVPLYQHKNKL